MIRLAGGAAKSPLWAQIFADVIGIPVETIDADELGALGCAMAAAVSAGVYANLKEAAFSMVRVGHRYEPSAVNLAIYRSKLSRHRGVSDALKGQWGGTDS